MTLVKRGGKRTGIYPNEWNVKFKDDTIKSVDFDREVQTWKTKIPESHTETINSKENNSDHDNDISDTIQNLSRLSICNYTHLTLRPHSSRENKSRKMFFSFHQKKHIPRTFGIS